MPSRMVVSRTITNGSTQPCHASQPAAAPRVKIALENYF